jgi:tRNA-2-methylthio-N6-dimethylallyladenosine synthase
MRSWNIFASNSAIVHQDNNRVKGWTTTASDAMGVSCWVDLCWPSWGIKSAGEKIVIFIALRGTRSVLVVSVLEGGEELDATPMMARFRAKVRGKRTHDRRGVKLACHHHHVTYFLSCPSLSLITVTIMILNYSYCFIFSLSLLRVCSAWTSRQSPRQKMLVTLSSATVPKDSAWFPRRIQEDVDYSKVVESAFVRHIVVETKDMAQLALQKYLQSQDEDPFGQLASVLSACPHTRAEGGRVGWLDVDVPDFDASTLILPKDVQRALFDLAPKAGDVHVIESATTKQIHVVKVEELSVLHRVTLNVDDPSRERVGSHAGKNALIARSKLKGQGVTPIFPSLKDGNKTYLIQTAGCQMNAADSERLAGVLEHKLGLTLSTNPKDADVVIFNTCTIRDHAEQKLYDALGPFAAKKRNGRQLALIVTGCVAQQEGENLLRRVPEIDVVLGPQYVPHLQNVLESVEWGHQVVATAPMIHNEDFSKPIRDHPFKAWVNVIYGCNEHCTYCVVPAVRGMEQSRTMEALLSECMELAKDGYKEVTLLGQNIDAYGRDMTPKRNFADLLHYLNTNLPPKMRIRYVTSHPRYFSDRVIDAVADLDKVCECFHVPFQAGDDEVLRRMRRGYTFDSYMRIIDKIKEKSPDAAICGDVIVGFPGETDEAFQRTLDLMNAVKFDNLNTFAYSPRPNTEAALWEDQVPEDVKSARLQIVQKLAEQHGMERSMRYLGRTMEVLVEGGNPRNQNQVQGRTRQGRQVFFDGDLEKINGELVDVKVTEARTWSLMGEMI